MNKFADLIAANAKELAELDSLCMGAASAAFAGMLIPECAAVFRCMFMSQEKGIC